MNKFQMNTIKQNKFSAFFQIISKFIPSNEENEEKKREIELNKEFKLWLKNEDFEYCAQIHGNGFPINASLKTVLYDSLKKILKADENFILKLKKYYKDKIPQELFDYWMFNSLLKTGNEIILNKIFCDMLVERFKTEKSEDIIDLCLTNIKNTRKNLSNANLNGDSKEKEFKFLNSLWLFNFVLKNSELNIQLNLNETIDIKNNLKKYIKKESLYRETNYVLDIQKCTTYITYIHTALNEKLKEKKDIFIESTLEIKEQDIIENIKEKLKNDISRDLDILPKEILDKLKILEKKFYKIKKFHENTKVNENNIVDYSFDNIKKLYEEKLPKILQKYLLIDEENKDILLNIEGKNSKKLLIESINHIEDIFDKCIIDKDNYYMTELSINQRHLKSINIK